jgi:hypothetical protein
VQTDRAFGDGQDLDARALWMDGWQTDLGRAELRKLGENRA